MSSTSYAQRAQANRTTGRQAHSTVHQTQVYSTSTHPTSTSSQTPVHSTSVHQTSRPRRTTNVSRRDAIAQNHMDNWENSNSVQLLDAICRCCKISYTIQYNPGQNFAWATMSFWYVDDGRKVQDLSFTRVLQFSSRPDTAQVKQRLADVFVNTYVDRLNPQMNVITQQLSNVLAQLSSGHVHDQYDDEDCDDDTEECTTGACTTGACTTGACATDCECPATATDSDDETPH